MSFAILRSPSDAIDDNITRLKGYEIDPTLGPCGGFFLETVERSNPKGREVIEKRTDEDKQREWDGERYAMKVVRRRQVFTCKATAEDARYYAGLRPGWWYIPCPTDIAEQAVRDMAPTELSAGGAGTVASIQQEAARVQQEAMGQALEGQGAAIAQYRELQGKAAAIKENGGPAINLNATKGDLQRYVIEHASKAPKPTEPVQA